MWLSFWPKNFVLAQLLFMCDTRLMSLHCSLVTAFQVALLPQAWCWGMLGLPHIVMGCVSPCCSLVLPVPFPAMHHVGPELLMPSCLFRTTFLPERLCPLQLVCDPCACHNLPFILVHYPSLLLSQSPKFSLRQAQQQGLHTTWSPAFPHTVPCCGSSI